MYSYVFFYYCSADGSDWKPSKHARICSEHFVDGKKSEHPHHPAYIPSVFPHKRKTSAVDASRFLRMKRRKENRGTNEVSKLPLAEVNCEDFALVAEVVSVGCQTKLDYTLIMF